jgi:hypothetical protein
MFCAFFKLLGERSSLVLGLADGEGFDSVSASADTESTYGSEHYLPGAESGAVGAQNTPIDPDLAEVIRAWPTLPEATRAGILAAVRGVRST